MTPFDPVALLAMLQAFYPIVGPGALARARTERPEYFAGGALVGSSGDKLQLPDGRIFDLIFDVLGPNQHWQVLDVSGPSGPAAERDPFALEDGPLRPIDESAWPLPAPQSVFAPLVAGHLGELAGADAVLSGAAAGVLSGPSPAEIDADLAGPIDDAGYQVWQDGLALDPLIPNDVVGATFGQHAQVPGREAEYSEPIPPDDTPDVPAPD